MRRWLIPLLLLFPVCGWGLGFIWFTRMVDALPDTLPRADGIVALTGGAARVETALQLLARGQAPILLLSGIGGGAELAQLDDRAGVDGTDYAERITLGRGAASTHGNATETANWANEHHLRSLIVVTAAYHMPRALLELHRAMPDVALYPAPVRPTGFSGWRRFELMAGEFTKFLGAGAGLSLVAPQRPAIHHRAAAAAMTA